LIDHPEFSIGTDGKNIMTITGDSTARKLVWANTLLALTYSNETITTIANDLVSGTTWTMDIIDGVNTVTARYDGSSIWSALLNVAESTGKHIRENNLDNTIDLFNAGTSTGLVFRNIDTINPIDFDDQVLPIVTIKITENETDLWNRIIPLGNGVADNALTLEHSNLASPYTIQTMVGPDGKTIWYIEDTDSQDLYDIRTKVLKVDSIAPISNSTAEIENAANTLYEISSAWLGWHAFQKDTYDVTVVGLRHYDDAGNALMRVGDTIRLQYRGIVESENGKFIWKDVDEDLYIMKMARNFMDSGQDSWTITLSTVDQLQDDNPITKAINDIWALQTALKPYTYTDINGPIRLTADGTHNFQMSVNLDENVTYLHRAILSVTKRRIRSNVSTASGGGSHSHSVSGQTASSGGGSTSSGGTSHTHAMTAFATVGETAPFHKHQTVQAGPIVAWTDPAFAQTMLFYNSDGDAYGVVVGRSSNTLANTNLWTTGGTAHGHTINSQISQAESSHTHSVSAHTHSVTSTTSGTQTDHTHALTYGIYEGPTANAPQINVIINGQNVTVALGGPWDDTFTADITQYFVDVNGMVLRQTNTIELEVEQLCDLEVTVRSLMSAMAIVPV
jgi:hypothetical protein